MMMNGIQGKQVDRETKAARTISERIQSGEIKILSAMTFWRDPKRKPKEPFHVYKRSMSNFNKARKARLRGGPGASLLLDKVTLRIIW